MRILHFCFTLDTSRGGVSSGTLNLVKQLTKYGIKNQIVSTGNTVDQIRRNLKIQSDFDSIGVEYIHTISKFENDYGLGSLKGLRKRLEYLSKPDLVVLHQIYTVSTLIGFIYAKKYKIPFAVMPHGSLTKYHESDSKIRKAVAKWLVISKILREAEAIIVTCESERDDLTIALKSKAFLLKYGAIARNSDSELEQSLPIDLQKNYIVFSGRFDKKKNLNLVIMAMPQILEIYPDLILNVAGSGNVKEIRTMRNLVSALKLERNVRFLGWIDNSKMSEVLASARLLVLPSENENFAIVVAEALSAGVPCVISKFVGTADIIVKHHAGEVIEELTPTSVAKGVIKVLQGDQKMYRDAAFDAVEHSLNWSQIALEWKALITSLA